jgi:hypothetical protein
MPRRPDQTRDVPGPAPCAGTPGQTLQGDVGNQGFGRLLAIQRAEGEPATVGNQAFGRSITVQRVDAEAATEFRGYVAGEDWARAAWVLDTWAAADITRQVRSMPVAQLEALVEGAWHGGKNNVVDAVKAVNSRAAVVGAVRMLVWSHRWDEAVDQLETLGHKDAITFSKSLLASGRIDEDDLRILIRRSPNLQFNPGDALKVGSQRYVVYVETVRYGGTFAWRNNNPGNLKHWDGAEKNWGSIGVDDKNFLIFPDESLGKVAIVKDIRHKAGGSPTILGMMEAYAPRKDGNDPDLYAAKVAAALGQGLTPQSALPADLSEEDFQKIANTIVRTEGTVKGEEVPHHSTDLPLELLERLTP